MHFTKFFGQNFGRQYISDFPTGDMVKFPEGSRQKTSFFQLRKLTDAEVLNSIENNVLIHFITQNQNIRVLNNLN